MPRRQQVTYNPPGATIDPVASPSSRPFVPRLPKDVMLPVDELAGLSQTLAKISVDQAEKQADVDRQIGIDAAKAAPADVIEALAQAHKDQDTVEGRQRANQEIMAKAVKEGRIRLPQNPWVQVGFVQGAAHRLMAGYDAKLNARMAEATATTDPATGDPVIAKSPDAVANEVWKEYADNPILQNYYGSQVAQQIKANADTRFAHEAGETLANNQVRDTITGATNSLTAQFFTLGVSGQEPTPETWTTIKGAMAELHAKTGGKADQREIMLAAIEGAASQMDAADSGEGVSKGAELIRDLRGAPSGSTTAGKDAFMAPKLEALIAHYEAQHKKKAEAAGAAEANKRTDALRAGEKELFARIDKAKELGAVDVLSIREALAAEFRESQKFGDLTGTVNAHLDEVALSTGAVRGKITAAGLIQSLDNGTSTPDQVEYDARMLMSELGLDEFRNVMKEADSRRNIRPLIEDSPISDRWDRDLNTSAQIPGIPQGQRGEIGVEAQAQNDDLISDFNARRVTAMKKIAALPEGERDAAQREWGDENVAELKKTLQENGQKFKAARATSFAKVQDLIDRSQPVGAILQTEGEYLSTEQQAYFRAQEIDATDYEKLTKTETYQRGLATVIRKIESKYKADPDVDLLVEAATRTHHDLFVDSIGATLAGTEPSKKTAAIYTAARELTDQVLEEVDEQKLLRFEEAAEPGGETVPEAKASLDFAAQDRDAALAAVKITDPAERAAALVTTNPNVPESVLDYQTAFVKGAASWSGSPFSRVEKKDVEARIDVDGWAAVVGNTAMSPVEQAQTLVDMHKVTGLNAEDLLARKIVHRPTANWTARATKYLTQIQGVDDPRFVAQRKLIRDALDKAPEELSLEGVQVPIYTTPIFESEAELGLWANTRKSDLQKIFLDNGGLAGEPAFEEFLHLQTAVIKQRDQER